jgi:hypothetical protein
MSVVLPSSCSRHGCVVGSPKMCRMESSLTLPRVVRGGEKLRSGYEVVGFQPTGHGSPVQRLCRCQGYYGQFAESGSNAGPTYAQSDECRALSEQFGERVPSPRVLSSTLDHGPEPEVSEEVVEGLCCQRHGGPCVKAPTAGRRFP